MFNHVLGIWWFPRIGVPPSHLFLVGFSIETNHFRVPQLRKPPHDHFAGGPRLFYLMYSLDKSLWVQLTGASAALHKLLDMFGIKTCYHCEVLMTEFSTISNLALVPFMCYSHPNGMSLGRSEESGGISPAKLFTVM